MQDVEEFIKERRGLIMELERSKRIGVLLELDASKNAINKDILSKFFSPENINGDIKEKLKEKLQQINVGLSDSSEGLYSKLDEIQVVKHSIPMILSLNPVLILDNLDYLKVGIKYLPKGKWDYIWPSRQINEPIGKGHHYGIVIIDAKYKCS